MKNGRINLNAILRDYDKRSAYDWFYVPARKTNRRHRWEWS